MDGASGWPLPDRGGKTTLELAQTPNLDRMAREGFVGMVRTVPPGMEPSSACACMSVLGYDPRLYYSGRSGIEAISMGVPVADGDVTFRCNLVTVGDGRMQSYCAGHISTAEGRDLILAIDAELGSEEVRFYPGVSYRHICKLANGADSLQAVCTPPHDIPGKRIEDFLPNGPGSEFLRSLMSRSDDVLRGHDINRNRVERGELPATMIWLFWGSGKMLPLPSLTNKYGISAGMTSAVDLLRGLAIMAHIDVLEIPGVTDGLDNDFSGQMSGAMRAMGEHDMVIVHVEAPDEAGHAACADDKIEAIERIDRDMVAPLMDMLAKDTRVMVLPDHPTPVAMQTHSPEPVPFLLWGSAFPASGVRRYTEAEAKMTGVFVENGHTLIDWLLLEEPQ